MSYKKLLIESNIQQKELLKELHEFDKRVDKPLLSKIVNYVVLPTKSQLIKICDFLQCHVLDLYEPDEIDLISVSRNIPTGKKKKCKSKYYNLHVEIDRKLADKVFAKESLQKLGINKLSDYVRDCIDALAIKLERIEKVPSLEEANQNKDIIS